MLVEFLVALNLIQFIFILLSLKPRHKEQELQHRQQMEQHLKAHCPSILHPDPSRQAQLRHLWNEAFQTVTATIPGEDYWEN